MDEPAYDELSAEDTVERTVYPSPVEGCYKILAVDDQGHTVTTPDGTTLVNVILQKKDEDFFVGSLILFSNLLIYRERQFVLKVPQL